MRKINRIRNGNKNRLYYIFGMIAICAFVSIGIGYSIMSSTVKIDGTASITSTWRVVFTKAVENTMQGATTTAEPSITGGTTLDIGVELDEKGSQAIYDVTVENQGTIDSYVKEIRLNDGEPTDLKVYISGLYKGFALKAGESKQFQVIAEWSASAPESSETEKNVNVSVDFEQETEDVEQPQLSMPTYTVDYPNEVWTKEKNVTMTYPEGENLLYQYSTDGGKTWLIAPSRVYVLKFTTEGTLYIRVSDGVSVLTTPLITIDKIDGTVPEVQVNGNDSEWTTSKTLTINASDKESGLATNPYSWDGGKTWTSVKEKEFTSNQTVNIWVKDNAGNINKQSVTISKIDNQAPTNVTLKEGLITSSSISVTANATQTGGGIKGYQFSIDNGAWSSEQTSATKTFTGLTKNTSYQIKVRVIANNGKYTDSSNITIKTNDITVPTYSVVDDGPNFTKEVTINYPDVKTINLVYEYSTDGGKSWMAIGGTTTTITFTEDGSVIARVRDTGNNNNTVTASTLTIQFPINMLMGGLRLGNLKNIEFVNDIAPKGTEFIDVSEEQNGSIQLWTDTNGKSYIGSKKKIYGNTNSERLFYTSGTNTLEAIEFNDYFDTSQVTNMNYMFSSASSLTSLDISNWDTSNVINMRYVFYKANKLTTLNLTNWDTSKVTDMHSMFYETSQLISMGDISNWDVSNVTDMGFMFTRASKLTSIGNLVSWNTSKVTDMGSMFNGLSSITTLGDISNWDISNVKDSSYMFYNMSNLTSLNLTNWDTSKVTNMSSMFSNTKQLTSVGNLTNWDTSQVTNMKKMFYGVTKLASIGDLSSWDTSQVTDMASMFYEAKALTNLNLTNWDVSKVTDMSFMFTRASKLSNIGDISNWKTVSVINMRSMFNDIGALSNIGNLTNWDVSKVTNMGYMFYKADALSNIGDLSSWNTSQVTDMSYMFYNTSSTTGLNLTNWDTSQVTNMSYMFYSNLQLNSVGDISNWDTSKVTNMSSMFGYTGLLANLNFSNWDTSQVTDMSSMFAATILLEDFDVSTWNTSKVTNMSGMFEGVTSISEWCGLSNWDTSQVTDMSSMFETTTGISYLDISNWDTSKVTTATKMFNNAYSLSTIKVGDKVGTNLLSQLPKQLDNQNIPLAGEYWYSESTGTGYLPENIPGNKADTYTVIEPLNMLMHGLTLGDLSSVEFVNYLAPAGTDYIDVSEVQNGSIQLWTDMTGKSYIGSTEKIYGNKNSSLLFSKTVGANNLETIIFNDNFDTSKVVNMYSMFKGAENITELDLSAWDTTRVTSSTSMFKDLIHLERITVSDKVGTKVLSQLPQQSSANIQGADGKWYSESTGLGYLPADIPGNTADTYTATEPLNMLISGLRLGSLENIEFVDYLAPTNTNHIDVSNLQNDSIQLWTDTSGNSYIGSKKKIYGNSNSSYLFYNASGANTLKSIVFNNYFDTSEITNMNSMFRKTSNLTSLDLTGWDTSKVTNMSFMFFGMDALTNLNVSTWDTSNVTNMRSMFSLTQANTTTNQSKLTTLNIANWNTSKVTDMSSMFFGQDALTTLNLSNWDTSKVTNMSNVFAGMNKLTTIDLSDWNTSQVTNMSNLFSFNKNLTSVGDISKWNTSQVTNMSYMFQFVEKLTGVRDLTKWDTSKVTNISYMFYYFKTTSDVSFTISSKMTNYTSFVDGSNFKSGTTRLRLYDDGTKAGYDLVETMVSGFGSSTITHAGVLKDGMTLLNLNRTGWLPSNVEYVQFVTMGPSSTDTTVDLSKDDDGTVLGWQRNTTYFIYRLDKQATVANPNSSWLFGAMSDQNLKRINFLGFFNTVNVTNFSNMFYGRMGLTSIDLNRLDTSNATNYSFMFGQCTALTTLDASTLDFDGVTNTISMFSQATNLTTTLTVKGNTITSYNNMFGQNAAQNGKITVKGDGTNSSLITKLIGTSTNGKVVAG